MTTAVHDPTLAATLRRAVETGIEEAKRRGEEVLVSVSIATPPFDPVALFERTDAEERSLWEQPGERFSLVGVGAAVRWSGSGDSRFDQATTFWRRLRADAVVEASEPCPLAAPVALAGFAFDPNGAEDAAWEHFPSALLVVPRILFVSKDDTSSLIVSTLVTPESDLASEVETLLAELAALTMMSGNGVSAQPAVHAVAATADEREDAWRADVAAIVDEIEAGAVQKLVLARSVEATAPAPIAPGPVLRRLREQYDHCTIFAFARGESCFLGATPERLVRLDRRIVRADSLAGSAARGVTDEEDRSLGAALLADTKERNEHALVVEALREMLAPLTSGLNVPQEPRLMRMANVQHLHTPLEGTLAADSHILELVERLHPTPASGGFPKESALALLRTHEPFDRGWYAGPVGWIDGQGGGEFAVAIRSALLRRNEARLYAGCGIVAGSDPEREYEESCLKLRPMLWALNGNQT